MAITWQKLDEGQGVRPVRGETYICRLLAARTERTRLAPALAPPPRQNQSETEALELAITYLLAIGFTPVPTQQHLKTLCEWVFGLIGTPQTKANGAL